MSNQDLSHQKTQKIATLKWYILQTYVGFEGRVKEILNQKVQNLGLDSKIQEVYIPTKKTFRVNKKGERKEKIQNVYPGYIYIKMILDKETGYLIQNTPYVSRITGTGDHAVPLEEGYVEKIKEQMQEENNSSNKIVQNIYKEGDLVNVMDGPFKNMSGRVQSIDPQNNRIKVNVVFFDREVEVDLDITEVEKNKG
jgi:transcriptional antiterminator NusG